MLSGDRAFSGFSVSDTAQARRFYRDTLGLDVREEGDMFLYLTVRHGAEVLVYASPSHRPASFTVLNFEVDDIETAVDELTARGVRFERYEGAHHDLDARGIARGQGPPIAWFKDPAGNTLAVLQST